MTASAKSRKSWGFPVYTVFPEVSRRLRAFAPPRTKKACQNDVQMLTDPHPMDGGFCFDMKCIKTIGILQKTITCFSFYCALLQRLYILQIMRAIPNAAALLIVAALFFAIMLLLIIRKKSKIPENSPLDK